MMIKYLRVCNMQSSAQKIWAFFSEMNVNAQILYYFDKKEITKVMNYWYNHLFIWCNQSIPERTASF